MNDALTPMDALAARVEELIILLETAREPYWVRWMQRALERIDANQLAGVSQVLAAYGGQDSFSDLEVAQDLAVTAPHRHRALNERLVELRTEIHQLANTVASGTAS
ncbi:MAG: hypothetical protein EA417_12225 [Gammaproteobacteria bacterium]|nr:MAG: hypothetical protein EA417_12225 [Gammaproteobacteria bacterium]